MIIVLLLSYFYWSVSLLSFSVLNICLFGYLEFSGYHCIKTEAWTPQSTPGGGGHWERNIWIRDECSILPFLKNNKGGRSCSSGKRILLTIQRGEPRWMPAASNQKKGSSLQCLQPSWYNRKDGRCYDMHSMPDSCVMQADAGVASKLSLSSSVSSKLTLCGPAI
jgi:hypothetical protein